MYVQGMQDCISDVKTWMTSNKFKLNDDKTECLLIVSNRTSLPNPHLVYKSMSKLIRRSTTMALVSVESV